MKYAIAELVFKLLGLGTSLYIFYQVSPVGAGILGACFVGSIVTGALQEQAAKNAENVAIRKLMDQYGKDIGAGNA